MAAASRPDIVVILADDMGFSDIGCYGGEVATPNLDRLARSGVRMSQFYNTARCTPSRASLMTGLHPHQVGIGILNFDDSPEGYPGNLSPECVTIAEALRPAGYRTHLSGKWHLASDMDTPNDAWPTRRGFDEVFGTLDGAGSFYQPRTLIRGEERVDDRGKDADFFYTDAITDHATGFIRDHHEQAGDDPMFLFVAYTAPHWPLHAHPEDIDRYRGRFDAGWDELRRARLQRLVDEGLLDESWLLSERDPRVPAWDDTPHQDWQASRMAAYAAQIDRMDQGIGRILDALEQTGRLDNTLVVFLSDNGGCAEEMEPEDAEEFITTYVPMTMTTRDGDPVVPGNVPGLEPGPESTYQSYGRCWANLSNTPFREFKHWVHEGGISTPLIAHWPAGLGTTATIDHHPHQLVDLLPTLLDVAGAEYPTDRDGHRVPPAEGRSMTRSWRGDSVADVPLYFEHEGNAAVRYGRWKLVRKYAQEWELYDLVADRTELTDLAADHPERVAAMAADYEAWAQRCGVIPRERVLALYEKRGHGLPPE